MGGGATRHESHGAQSTNDADPVRAVVAQWAILAKNQAPAAHHGATAPSDSPEICAIVMAGMATKCRARPATPTRMNTEAVTGRIIISAATVARNTPHAAFMATPQTRLPAVALAKAGGSTVIRPRVAPKDSHA